VDRDRRKGGRIETNIKYFVRDSIHTCKLYGAVGNGSCYTYILVGVDLDWSRHEAFRFSKRNVLDNVYR
jgi:hypothetical protein